MALLDFFKRMPGIAKMLPILILGILLLVLASGRGGSNAAESDAQTDLTAYGEALEKKLETMCEQVRGVGQARVMITFASGERTEVSGGDSVTRPPEVQGATVLCTGGNDSEVRASLSEMLSALLGIGASRICILPLAGG